ncbi:uncharacterized protein LOC34617954 [Cyclospora cayetanensis]|nr:uncharacterized protein LOC34617954 [Cyclospora cayetanensis]
MTSLEAIIAQNFPDDGTDPPSAALGALTPSEAEVPERGVTPQGVLGASTVVKEVAFVKFPVPKSKKPSHADAQKETAAAAEVSGTAGERGAAVSGLDGVPVVKYGSLFEFSDTAEDDWVAVRNLPRLAVKKEGGAQGAPSSAEHRGDSRSRRLALLQSLPKPQGVPPTGCLGSVGFSSGLSLSVRTPGDDTAAAPASGNAAIQMVPRALQQKQKRGRKQEDDGAAVSAPNDGLTSASSEDLKKEAGATSAEAAATAPAEEPFLTSMFTLYESDGEEEAGAEPSSCREVKDASKVKDQEAVASAWPVTPAAQAAHVPPPPAAEPSANWVSRGEEETLQELGIDKTLLQASGISSAELRDLRRMGTTTVSGDSLKNPDWYAASTSGPLAKKAKLRLATKVWSAKDGTVTETLEPKFMQKRKHQINWLAAEAHEKELEMLELTARTRQSKYQTAMKYGW